MRKRVSSLLLCGAALFGITAAARAQPSDVFCADTRPIVVIGPKKDSSELVKQLGEGGGLAGLGVKLYGVSNTAEAADSLLFLKRYFPAFATEEAASVLTSLARSSAAKIGALGVAAVGGYLVFEGMFGNDQSGAPELPPGALNEWKPIGPLVPCGRSLSQWGNPLAKDWTRSIDTRPLHAWQVPVTGVPAQVKPDVGGTSALPLKTTTVPNYLTHMTPPPRANSDPLSSLGAFPSRRSTAPVVSPLTGDVYNYSGDQSPAAAPPAKALTQPEPLWPHLVPQGTNSQ